MNMYRCVPQSDIFLYRHCVSAQFFTAVILHGTKFTHINKCTLVGLISDYYFLHQKHLYHSHFTWKWTSEDSFVLEIFVMYNISF